MVRSADATFWRVMGPKRHRQSRGGAGAAADGAKPFRKLVPLIAHASAARRSRSRRQ